MLDASFNLPAAQVGPEIAPTERFYANGVHTLRAMAAENWTLWHIRVNAGISSLFLKEASPEQEALIDVRNLDITFEGKVMSVINGNRTLFTLDVSAFLAKTKEDQNVIGIFGHNFSEIILLAVNKGYKGPLPRNLDATDLNPNNETVCDHPYADHFMQDKGNCGRPAGHAGNHQFFTERGHGDADSAGSRFRCELMYGLPKHCVHCGFMSAGSEEGKSEYVCSSCSFWLYHLARKSRNTLIIEGSQYSPGEGGFGGRIFKVLRNDGTRWSGQLFTQGNIPQHLLYLFPNNAVFED